MAAKKKKKVKRIGFERRKVKDVPDAPKAAVWSAQGSLVSTPDWDYHTHGAERPFS